MQMTYGEGVDQEIIMKSRSLSTEAPSTLTKEKKTIIAQDL